MVARGEDEVGKQLGAKEGGRAKKRENREYEWELAWRNEREGSE